jgi:ADP-ribosylation factor-binding protein GGA
VDPFAALASPVQQSTPQQSQPHSIFDFANPAPAPAAAPTATADDDEWAFSSALPEGLPAENTILVSETSLSILLYAAREPQTPAVITMSISFSSKTDQPISELTFMAAVTKVRTPLTKAKRSTLSLTPYYRDTHSNSNPKADDGSSLTNKLA